MMGCSSSIKPVEINIAPQENLRQPCVELPVCNAKTEGELMKYTIDIIGLYNICQAKQAALSKSK